MEEEKVLCVKLSSALQLLSSFLVGFSAQQFLSVTFPLCSFGLISALLVLSTIYVFTKISLSPDIILRG